MVLLPGPYGNLGPMTNWTMMTSATWATTRIDQTKLSLPSTGLLAASEDHARTRGTGILNISRNYPFQSHIIKDFVDAHLTNSCVATSEAVVN